MTDAREELPDRGRGRGRVLLCWRDDCPAPDFREGFGLAGGGYGVYEYCEICGHIVSKTQVEE
jgi:hypothetical protein